jgi:Ni/Co efflux regulator RcnB
VLWAADEHKDKGGGAPAAEHHATVRRAAPAGGGMRGHTERATTEHGSAERTESRAATRHHRTTTGTETGRTERETTRTRTHVDVSSYHKNVTAERRYHFGDYNAPQGYSYHRYGYGDRLPDGYFGRSYWIVNFLNFGLTTPPDGYVWVRYGPDALLIDEDTGEIVQVVYDQFY